jgi:hypothetical protein
MDRRSFSAFVSAAAEQICSRCLGYDTYEFPFTFTFQPVFFSPFFLSFLFTQTNRVLAKEPKHSTLFRDIGKYILSLKTLAPEPPSKKRKIDDGKNGNDGGVIKKEGQERNCLGGDDDDDDGGAKGEEVVLVKEISFSVPQRKKFSLSLSTTSMNAVNVSTGKVEFGVSWDDIGFRPLGNPCNAMPNRNLPSLCLRAHPRVVLIDPSSQVTRTPV